jgi:hypothetical protein
MSNKDLDKEFAEIKRLSEEKLAELVAHKLRQAGALIEEAGKLSAENGKTIRGAADVEILIELKSIMSDYGLVEYHDGEDRLSDGWTSSGCSW